MARYASTEQLIICAFGCKLKFAINHLIIRSSQEHGGASVGHCPACDHSVCMYYPYVHKYALFIGDHVNQLPDEMWSLRHKIFFDFAQKLPKHAD